MKHPHCAIQLLVRPPQGKTIAMNFHRTDMCRQVHEAISVRMGMPVPTFYLVYQGRVLRNSNTLQECSIDGGALIHVTA